MTELTKLSLFSGIGGDDLASEWAGIKTVCFVERDKYCQQVLAKHWPNIPIIDDVKKINKEYLCSILAQNVENLKKSPLGQQIITAKSVKALPLKNGEKIIKKSTELMLKDGLIINEDLLSSIMERDVSVVGNQTMTSLHSIIKTMMDILKEKPSLLTQPYSDKLLKRDFQIDTKSSAITATMLRQIWEYVRTNELSKSIIGDVKDATKEKIVSCAKGLCSGGKLRDCEEEGNQIQEGRQEINAREQPVCASSRYDEGWGRIDIISGGFPCQPHSVAGKRKGSSDERNLWPEFRKILDEIKPRWVVAENVPGIFSSDNGDFFGAVISDLASLGYSVGWCCYGAVDVGALHRRDRVFIVAYSNGIGWNNGSNNRSERYIQENIGAAQKIQPERDGWFGGISEACAIPREDVADTNQQRPQGRTILRECGDKWTTRQGSMVCNTTIQRLPDWAGGEMGQPSPLTEFERPSGEGKEREVERNFRGVSHGVSRRVDRLKGLGNAVVPQQIYPIYKAIVDIEQSILGGC